MLLDPCLQSLWGEEHPCPELNVGYGAEHPVLVESRDFQAEEASGFLHRKKLACHSEEATRRGWGRWKRRAPLRGKELSSGEK